ncbi:rna-directed dna polymerase from mobile element jockey-like [Pitangus sulphuratus]|nr:rna-directed dna polymerase from mobile element jockey-like [Pitangus sulphuratus]
MCTSSPESQLCLGLHQEDEDGHLTNRDRDKAEVFNAFFASFVNTDEGPRGPQCPEQEDHECENDQLPVNTELVRDLLLHLDPYKTIHDEILKELVDVIAKPLSMIFEWSWESGEVQAEWKLMNLAPIFKNGKKEDPRNYRPVSLTTVPSKIMEKIILGGIEKHLKGVTASTAS